MGSRGLRAAAAVVMAFAAAACSSSGSTHTDAYAQRFADGGTCPVASAPGLPHDAGCVTSASADLDGDGNADRFVVYAVLRHRTPVSWWAVALVGDATTPPLRVPVGQAVGGSSGIYPRVAGAANADGRPGDEAFVQLSADIYHGAAPPIDAIYAVRGGRVVPVTSGGRFFTFRTGGISRFGDGARCGNGTFTLTHVDIVPDGWRWSERAYRWRGLDLVPGASTTGHLPVLSIGDIRVYRFYQLICGRLRLSEVTNSYPRA